MIQRDVGSQPENGRRGYDRAMIRDFFHHLLWELRAATFDHEQHRRGARAGHPELDEILDRYFRQYGAGLLPLTMFDNEGATAGQIRAARRELDVTLPSLRRSQLRLLEGLLPLIEDALECANPFLWEDDHVPVRALVARKFRPEDSTGPGEPERN